ncbi:MAG: substrate-binding domain-containing protein [Bryobacteraceae bacterium]|nr:substrate-binding domain-containing protein [Bryobacteraceae bacterium]
MPASTRRAFLASASLLSACRRDAKKIIGVVPQGQSHLFWQTVHAGAVAASRDANVDVIWNGPATETDYSTQIQIVDALINRRVDAIALAPIDRKSMVAVVERAVKAGIPVIIFDSGIETESYTAKVATDNYAAGRVAGKRMAEILKGKGSVAIVAVRPGVASTIAREQGFEEELKENAPGIAVVDKRFGLADYAKSLAVSENMLTAHPQLNALFASNESSTVGAAQALKGRGAKVKLVGFDWSPSLLEDLRTGVIDSLVVQHPFKMGYESVMTAVKKFRGESFEKVNNLPPRLVTLENLNAPDVQEQLNPDLKKYLGGA